MRGALLENGVVVNIIEAEEGFSRNFIPSESANLGDIWNGSGFVKPIRVFTSEDVAQRRYQAEISGINMNGVYIQTDDRSKLLINGAALEATIDPTYKMKWKTSEGFIELNGEQVIAIARTVRVHVQACFDREAELLDLIASGEFTEPMLEQGWP